jgi:hypothetical protein
VDTAAFIIYVIYILALTSGTASRTMGLDSIRENTILTNVLLAFIFAATQGLMALLGVLLGNAFTYLFADFGRYMVFAMMVIVAARMFFNSFKILKGKRLYTFTSNWGYLLLSLLAGMNTFLMGLMGQYFLPFGNWFFVAVAAGGFLWACATIRIQYSPKAFMFMSFIEFSAAVFLIVIAVLYMFTNLI